MIYLHFFSIYALMSFADQISSDRFLQENKYFINYINIAITNFGTKKEIELFNKAAMHDFWAQVAYLQSNYKRTYTEIRKSQETQVDLYARTIDIYLSNAKKLLDRIAPTIIRSKDSKARLYLSLGYRDLTESKSQQVIAHHSSKRLYSYKIKRYIEAIKLSRRSKRYAILAIIQARTPRDKKLAIENLTYEEIGAKIKELQQGGDKELRPEYNIILHHVDNNQKTTASKTVKDKASESFLVQGSKENLSKKERIDIKNEKTK